MLSSCVTLFYPRNAAPHHRVGQHPTSHPAALFVLCSAQGSHPRCRVPPLFLFPLPQLTKKTGSSTRAVTPPRRRRCTPGVPGLVMSAFGLGQEKTPGPVVCTPPPFQSRVRRVKRRGGSGVRRCPSPLTLDLVISISLGPSSRGSAV